MNHKLISGAVVLSITVVFWLQRDYANPLAGFFPDFILVTLAVLSVILVVQGLMRPDRSDPFEDTRLPSLLVGVALLVAWVLLLGPLGFFLSGIALFLATALFLREPPTRPMNVIVDSVAAVLLTGGVYFFFTRLLLVPLPSGSLWL